MKLQKTASGKTTIKMSRKEWESYGKKSGWLDKQAGWMKEANDMRAIDYTLKTSINGLGEVRRGLSEWIRGDVDSVIHIAQEINEIEGKVIRLRNTIRNTLGVPHVD